MSPGIVLNNPMQLLINNTLTGEQWIEEIESDHVSIGRALKESSGKNKKTVQPDIALRSRFVSGQHAFLRKNGSDWFIENQAKGNRTKIGSLELDDGEQKLVDEGQEIQIGEFSLVLVKPGEQALDESSTDTRTEFMELERDIHNQLLKWMDLRRGENIDLESLEVRERIASYLDTLLNDVVDKLSDEFIRASSKSAFYNRLSYLVTAGGKESAHELDDYFQNNATITSYENTYSDIQSRFAAALEIEFDPKTMESDAHKLDAGFKDLYDKFELEFTRGLQVHLIRQHIRRDILDLVFGLGPLQDLLEMDSISEIMVISRNQIFVEKFGVVEDTRRSFFNDEMLLAVIERIVAPLGRRIDRSSPMVDARLKDGSRVNAIIPPLAVKGPCITIRKFSKVPLEITDLIKYGALSERVARFLQACVVTQRNIIVSGGTGTGKTTLLNCLSRYIPHKERIVTIEDTAEVQLKQPHVVTLESRPPNLEGKGAITIQDLVKNALRMRPDRIVVGECRGAEALDMLQAMNTGHDGSMTTAHANSPAELILRLETMVLMGTEMPVSAIREQIIAAINLVVQLQRFSDGRRCVTHISEVVGIDEDSGEVIVEDIFRFRDTLEVESAESLFTHTGYIPNFIDVLLKRGGIGLGDFF